MLQMKKEYLTPLKEKAPTPIAKLAERAFNESESTRKHHNSYYLFELWIRLLSIKYLVIYRNQNKPSDKIEKSLSCFIRPSIGTFVGFIKSCRKNLGDAKLKSFLASKLDADMTSAYLWCCKILDVAPLKSPTYEEFIDKLVTYRHKTIGHGALAISTDYEQGAPVLFNGISRLIIESLTETPIELLRVESCFDDNSGTKLSWVFEQSGNSETRVATPFEVAKLGGNVKKDDLLLVVGQDDSAKYLQLEPWVIYQKETAYFLNGTSRIQVQYLDYLSGNTFHDSGPLEIVQNFITSSPTMFDSFEADSSLENTRRIGSYELIDKIGQGGMGEVFEGRHLILDLPVAIKILPESISTDKVNIARFEREIETLRRCNHPNIVSIFDAGKDGNKYYYVMELISGCTLSDIYHHFTPLSKEEKSELTQKDLQSCIKEIMGQSDSDSQTENTEATAKESGFIQALLPRMEEIASALAHLNSNGIIHRDIKPGNIMLTEDGSKAVMMDFGLATINEMTRKTKTGAFVGTPRYASPEQHLKMRNEVDFRSDLYSLGATMYELFTLSPLFFEDEKTAESMSDLALLEKIQYKKPDKASTRNSALPNELDVVLEKLLEKERARRFYTFATLSQELSNIIEQRPILAREYTVTERRSFELYDSLREQAKVWYKEPKEDFLWGIDRVSELTELKIAQQFDLTDQEENFSLETQKYADGLKAKQRRAIVIRRIFLTALTILALAASGFAYFFYVAQQEAKISEAEAVKEKNNAREAERETALAAEKEKNARKLAEDEREDAESLVNFMLFRLRDILEPIGYLPALEGVMNEVVKYYDKSADRNTQLDEDNLRNRATSLLQLGTVQQELGKLSEAERFYSDSLKIFKHLASQDPSNAVWQRDLSVSYNNLGDLQKAQGNLKEAELAYKESLKIIKPLVEKDPSNTLWQRHISVSYNNLGDLQKAQGNLKEAELAYKESLRITKLLASQDPSNAGWQVDLVNSYGKMALLEIELDHKTEAHSLLEKAMAILKRLESEGRLSPVDLRLIPFTESLLLSTSE